MRRTRSGRGGAREGSFGPGPDMRSARLWLRAATRAPAAVGGALVGDMLAIARSIDVDADGVHGQAVEDGGRILALVETRLTVELSADLDTIGPYDFTGALERSMTAHPKTCPRTGELLFFSYGSSPPYLTYYRAEASGRVVSETAIAWPT